MTVPGHAKSRQGKRSMSEERSVLIFAGEDQSAAEFELLDENRKSYLPVSQIKANLRDFMQSLADILPTAETASGGYSLEGFTVAVGINGKGQVGFLGTGGELGGTAGRPPSGGPG
jgi:hypothetical protein